MRELEADIQALAQEFSGCRHILQALGDETRQHLICIMLQARYRKFMVVFSLICVGKTLI